MYVLITYDINTTTKVGQARLRKVAKVCENYGQRVQNSVFECKINETQFCDIQNQLVKIIDKKVDSLRFYRLGNNYNRRVKHIGAKETYKMDELLIL